MLRAGITEDAEVIPDFHALGTTQIDVESVVGTQFRHVALAGDNHRRSLAGWRSEAVKLIFGLERRCRAFGEGEKNIAALEVIAGILHLRPRGILMDHHDSYASLIFPQCAHFPEDDELPLGPLGLDGVFRMADC